MANAVFVTELRSEGTGSTEVETPPIPGRASTGTDSSTQPLTPRGSEDTGAGTIGGIEYEQSFWEPLEEEVSDDERGTTYGCFTRSGKRGRTPTRSFRGSCRVREEKRRRLQAPGVPRAPRRLHHDAPRDPLASRFLAGAGRTPRREVGLELGRNPESNCFRSWTAPYGAVPVVFDSMD